MKLRLFTLVLDGMPFIEWHLPVFRSLGLDWEWHIAEGVAKPQNCTSWCREIEPRVSRDGTTEYLDRIAAEEPRVKIHRRESWNGKIEMVNATIAGLDRDTLVMQIDSDELWRAPQIETVARLFKTRSADSALFDCRYFVGPEIAVVRRGGYGNKPGEWLRAFRMRTGMQFERHEPPVLRGARIHPLPNGLTRSFGLVFDHYAYATRKQVEFKMWYYGYTDAVRHWERLQANTRWPARLRDFLPWVTDGSIVEKVGPGIFPLAQ